MTHNENGGRPKASEVEERAEDNAELLRLNQDEGLTCDALAERFGMHKSTVWRRIQRARRDRLEAMQDQVRIRKAGDSTFVLDRGPVVEPFDFVSYLAKQRAWSRETFGPGKRTAGVVEHIGKELCEVLEAPDDVSEWIDIAILALDGASRMGFSPEQICEAFKDKQVKNMNRTWPDWRTVPEGQAIEHVREEGEV